jgi:hypothetical protein
MQCHSLLRNNNILSVDGVGFLERKIRIRFMPHMFWAWNI